MVEVTKAFLKRWGSARWKQRAWDNEYESGMWTRVHSPVESASVGRDSVLAIIERYAAGGDILELGCGAGETAFEIADNYQRYVGVDISDVAIRRGTEAAAQQPSRAHKVELVVGDISTFTPPTVFSVILFRESIYYIPKSKIPGTLHRLATFLTPHGVFIVRVHDRVKFRHILEMIERDYGVVDRSLPADAGTATIVFAARGSAALRTGW